MDFTFSEEHHMLRDLAREFAQKEVKPLAAKTDEEAEVPRRLSCSVDTSPSVPWRFISRERKSKRKDFYLTWLQERSFQLSR